MTSATKGRGLAASPNPSGDELLSAILDGAHETRDLRDGSKLVAFVLEPDLAERLFAFGSGDREDDGTAEDDDAEANAQAV